GAAALVRTARRPGDPEVDPPRADRRERSALRLRPQRAGDGDPRRTRPDRRDERRPGAEGVGRQPSGAMITTEALITAVTEEPSARPSSSTASTVIDATSR